MEEKKSRVIPILVIVVILLFAVNFLFLINHWKIEMQLNGDDPMTAEIDEKFKDPGVKASLTGTLLKMIHIDLVVDREGSVDVHTPGEYVLNYTAEFANMKKEMQRVVVVADTTPPEITLLSSENHITDLGATYQEEGYTAYDKHDGDLTAQVTKEEGDGIITYTVTDSSGNVAREVRHVTYDHGNQKIVYLTFDDGPGEYTEQLLETLKKHDAKATFFVTACYPNYTPLIKKEFEAGHSIGVHTYTHKYNVVYASDEAFWDDFEKMEEVIQQQTGSRTSLMRFPGGGSNTVSKKYSSGIMTRLAQQAAEKGLVYYDWNVSSGDAGQTTSTEQVYQNIMNGIHKNGISVVLCHDIKAFSVAAIDRVLTDAQAEGYVFLPLTETSVIVHHGINN